MLTLSYKILLQGDIFLSDDAGMVQKVCTINPTPVPLGQLPQFCDSLLDQMVQFCHANGCDDYKKLVPVMPTGEPSSDPTATPVEPNLDESHPVETLNPANP